MSDDEGESGPSVSGLGIGTDHEGVAEMEDELPDLDDMANDVVMEELERQEIPDDVVRPGDGEYVHTPVVGYQMINMYSVDKNPQIGGKMMDWWSENSISTHHPYVLVNPVSIADNLQKNDDAPAWHQGAENLENMRQHMNMSKGKVYVIADSGGFQLMSQDKGEIVDRRSEHNLRDLQIHPESLVEWQVRNADAGAILDRPPFLSNKGDIDATVGMLDWAGEDRDAESQFNNSLDDTVEYTSRMWNRLQEIREMDDGEIADDYEFVGVIHKQPVYREGVDEEVLARRWYEAMKEETEATFDAWSLTMKPVSLGAITFSAAFAYEYLRGETNYIHLLGAGSPPMEAFMVYAARETGLAITADSTNAHRGAIYRTFIFPHSPNVDMLSLIDADESEYGRRLEQYPCRCQVCDTIAREHGTELLNEKSNNWGLTGQVLHDLQVRRGNAQQQRALIRSTPELLDGLKADIEGTKFKSRSATVKTVDNEFWRIMRNYYSDKKLIELWRAMDFIRITADEGMSEAFRHYEIRNYFSKETNPSIVPRRKGVFG